ncbi:glycoside hydrolase family 3 protein [Porphyromonas sp.]
MPKGVEASKSAQIQDPLLIFRGIDPVAQQRWVDSVYKSMDWEERVGQLIMPIIYPRIGDKASLLRRMQEEKWGGILFQKGFLADQRELTESLQATSHIPLLIALDGEWGLYMRLKDAPRYPRSKGLGTTGDMELIRAYGAEVARQCQLMGIHINFAPVVDVNINPQNPVIGTRSFGDSPELVARCAVAYGQGLESGGVLSVAKHFPGHGDTSEDSHKTLPTVSASRERMQRVELYPFRAYRDAGLGGVMTAHLSVPAYDASGRPASLSRLITTDLLRKDIRFKGLVITDALEMRGAQVSEGNSVALEAFKAGNDILLGPSQPLEARNTILQALRSGEVKETEVEEKCRRILAFKYALIIKKKAVEASATEVKNRIWTREEAALRTRLWQANVSAGEGDDPTAKTKAMQSPTKLRR